ncbi:unnamed protein product, partial [Ceratitis capitata]
MYSSNSVLETDSTIFMRLEVICVFGVVAFLNCTTTTTTTTNGTANDKADYNCFAK